MQPRTCALPGLLTHELLRIRKGEQQVDHEPLRWIGKSQPQELRLRPGGFQGISSPNLGSEMVADRLEFEFWMILE